MEDIQYLKRDILSDQALSIRATAIAEELERKVTKIHLLRTTKDIQKLLTEGRLDASAAAALEEERLSKQVRLKKKKRPDRELSIKYAEISEQGR